METTTTYCAHKAKWSIERNATRVQEKSKKKEFSPIIDDADLPALFKQVEVVTTSRKPSGKRDAANAAAMEFAAALAHDLRSPLAAVGLFFSVLKERYGDTLDERTAEHLRRAEGIIERSGQLVQEHLDQLMAHSARRTERVDMEAATEEVLANLEAKIERVSAMVCRGRLPVVEGNPVQLRQLMQNLIENALTHARRAEPSVWVKAWRDGNDWIFSVSDNGRGFNADEAERLFERSYRGVRTTSRGSGLGLALCRDIVTRHGGRIWARSRVGEGSTFSFSLPARPVAENSSA